MLHSTITYIHEFTYCSVVLYNIHIYRDRVFEKDKKKVVFCSSVCLFLFACFFSIYNNIIECVMCAKTNETIGIYFRKSTCVLVGRENETKDIVLEN